MLAVCCTLRMYTLHLARRSAVHAGVKCVQLLRSGGKRGRDREEEKAVPAVRFTVREL